MSDGINCLPRSGIAPALIFQSELTYCTAKRPLPAPDHIDSRFLIGRSIFSHERTQSGRIQIPVSLPAIEEFSEEPIAQWPPCPQAK
jgi:hypothetical protein